MATFKNQMIGTYSKGGNNEYVEVTYDENEIQGFQFHNVGTHDAHGNYFGVHGVTVEARHAWAAMRAFANTPDKVVWKDGKTSWVTRVHIEGRNGQPDAEEMRVGGRWGRCVARMVKTGYLSRPVTSQ